MVRNTINKFKSRNNLSGTNQVIRSSLLRNEMLLNQKISNSFEPTNNVELNLGISGLTNARIRNNALYKINDNNDTPVASDDEDNYRAQAQDEEAI